MSALTPGIHYGVNPADYHKGNVFDPAHPEEFTLSKSMLWDFHKNPYKWRYKREDAEAKRKLEKATLHGSMVDCLALTPQLFDEQFAVAPETYEAKEKRDKEVQKPWNSRAAYCREWKEKNPGDVAPPATYPAIEKETVTVEKPWNWNAKHCDQWRHMIRNSGKVPVTRAEYDRAHEASNLLELNDDWKALTEGAEFQVALVFDYEDKVTKMTVRLKCLLDIVPGAGEFGDALADLKTSGMIDTHRDIEQTIGRFGYHVQADLYRYAFAAVTGEQRYDWFNAFQEDTYPYKVLVKPMDVESLNLGRKTWEDAVTLWCQCIDNDVWPDPRDSIETIGVPSWMK